MLKVFCGAMAMTTVMTMAAAAAPADQPAAGTHRYIVERTFPAGALDGLDAAVKHKVNANNQSVGVTWEKSYANANKTKTYCVYDGPDEKAVHEAAKLNGLPVDSITEIPVDLKAEPRGAAQQLKAGNQRFLVKRAGAANVKGDSDARFGVTLLTSYGTKDRSSTYWVYDAPSFSAIESAAKASGTPFESIVQIPETIYPN
jgi:hypothetical protein